jgi:hypothetical protein
MKTLVTLRQGMRTSWWDSWAQRDEDWLQMLAINTWVVIEMRTIVHMNACHYLVIIYLCIYNTLFIFSLYNWSVLTKDLLKCLILGFSIFVIEYELAEEMSKGKNYSSLSSLFKGKDNHVFDCMHNSFITLSMSINLLYLLFVN